VNSELTPQQLEGIQFIKDHNYRCLVADRAGSGKTYMVLQALLDQPSTFPVLIICIKVGLPVWKNELIKWFNETSVVYAGTPTQRKELHAKVLSSKFVIATYAMFDELIDVMGLNHFKTVILDEYHMVGLLNHNTKIYKSVKSIRNIIPNIIMVTGTPMRSTPADYFSALSIVDSTEYTFRSYWSYVDEYCIKIKGFFGYEIERMPNNVAKLQNMLGRYVINRPLDDLPDKLRLPIEVEMTKQQKKLFTQLQKDMMLHFEHNDQWLLTPNAMVKILRARQILVTPKIFGIEENGAGLDATIELTQQELSEDNSVIIFTPFRIAINYIEQEISKSCKDVQTCIIHGGMSAEHYDNVQTFFQTLKTKNKVMICTIKSGASMTLTEANVCIFLGYEWSAVENSQAEARSHRKGQTKGVRCYYILHKDTPDEDIRNKLNEKQLSIDVGTTPNKYLTKLLPNDIIL
jgi:SNF2 family DNA or RNA helicase